MANASRSLRRAMVAVIVQYFDNNRRRFEAGQSRQIAAGLGMSGAKQHAALASHDRKYVARLHDAARGSVWPNRRLESWWRDRPPKYRW